MKKINLLIGMLGIEEVQADKICEDLRENNVEVATYTLMYTKIGIEQALRDNPEIDTILLSEYLESSNPYTAYDLNILSEIRDNVTVVGIIQDDHNGTDYVKKLVEYSVRTIVFDKDATFENITNVIANGRTRREARLYYGVMDEENTEIVNHTTVDTSLDYLLSSTTKKDFKLRLDHIHNRMNENEFVLLTSKMPEDIQEVVRDFSEYETYFSQKAIDNRGKGYSLRKKGILFPSLNIKSFHGGSGKYKNIGSLDEKIGVISVGKGTGSTFVALNLAREFADLEDSDVSFLQLPKTESDIFERLDFFNHFGGDYISHMSELLDVGIFNQEQNTYQGINFILENTSHDCLDLWDYTHTIKLLYSIKGFLVTDLGNYYNKIHYSSVISEFQQLIVVVDGRQPLDIEGVRDIKRKVNKYENIELSFVVNFSIENDNNNYDRLFEQHKYIKLPIYSEKQLKKAKNNVFIYPAFKGDSIEDLISLTGHELSGGRKFNLSIFNKKKTIDRYMHVGTVELGFAGVSKGAGVTHTSIMCAQTLALDYKIAILELNNNRHYEDIYHLLNEDEDDAEAETFSISGVDYYFNMTYEDFVSSYKDLYDFVVIDFGVYDLKENKDAFNRVNIKMIATSGADWSLMELHRFTERVQEVDVNNSFIYMVPLLTNKMLGGIRQLCGGCKVYSVPYSINPFEPDDEIIFLFRELIGMGNRRRRKGLFGRK